MDRAISAGADVTGAAELGKLRLRAEVRGARTVLTDVYRTAPFHPGPLHYRDGMAEVILQDVSPGILPGDALHADVLVSDGAALAVSGQGATRIYPSVSGRVAASRLTLSVSGAGTLWWLPGPLIPFRAARYESRVEVQLDASSRFALLEIVTPGRVAMGERNVYERLVLRLRIEVAGRPRLIERSVLDPRERPVTMMGSQGEFPCSGTLIMVGYAAPICAHAHRDDLWLGAGGDHDLVVVRGLGRAAAPLRDALLQLLQDASRQQAGNDCDSPSRLD